MLPSERRPSASEELSPPLQDLPPPGPGVESGHGESPGHSVGDTGSESVFSASEIRKCPRQPRSSVNSEIAFHGQFEQHQRPTVEYGLECLGICEQAARVPFKGMWIIYTVLTDFRGLAGGSQPPYPFQPPIPDSRNLTDAPPLGFDTRWAARAECTAL